MSELTDMILDVNQFSILKKQNESQVVGHQHN